MAVLCEVDAFFSLIRKARNLVQNIADGWYKASQDVIDFPSQVKKLSDNERTWSNRLERFGMQDHHCVKAWMDEIHSLLDEQKSELDKLQGTWCLSNCCLRLCRRLQLLTFPPQLTIDINNIVSCFESVEKSLQDDERLSVLTASARFRQHAELPFAADSKYVLLEGTVKAVREALETVYGSRVVTLFGPSGSGKSSMARHLALLYQSGVNVPAVGSGQMPTVPGPSSTPTWFKHGVFFLHCGPKAVYSDILTQLWEKLGFQGLAPTSIDTSNLTEQSLSLPERESGPRLKEKLFALLKDQKVLIILDDVRESTLVEEVLVHRDGIKYLITALNSRVWPEGEQIRIERPSLEDARKIVGSHVKGFHGTVPESLKDVVDEIIQKCDHDPFDLANVAAKIGSEYAQELGEWESIARHLQDARDGNPDRPVMLYGRTYSKRTKSNALELHISTFRPELLTVLFTAAICDTQHWIPDVVFKIFFKRVHSSLATFWDCKAELTTSDLVKVHREKVEWSNIPQETLSIHDRYREFVDTSRKDQLEIMVKKLFGECSATDDDGSYTIVYVLLVLYGQKAWRDEAARRLNIDVSIAESNLARAVQPFVWLLHAGGQDEWQKQSHQHATEIILQYLQSGELDDHNMSKLLSLQQTIADSCGALSTMALMSDDSKSVLTGHHVDTVRCLLEILRNDVDSSNKRVAMDALQQLTSKYGFARFAGDGGESIVPLVLAEPVDWFLTLLKLKVEPQGSPVMRSLAFMILFDLAQGYFDAILVDNLLPTIWEDLVNSIGTNMHPTIQSSALSALAALYSHKEVSARMVTIPGALKSVLGGLVDLLSKDVSSDIQSWAAFALKQISKDSVENQVKIASFPGVLEALVGHLDQDVSRDVQKQATWALANLSGIHNNAVVGSFPGVLEGLVGLLARDIGQDIKKQVARVFANMTGTELENPINIGLFPGVVEGLVGLLAMDVTRDSEVQLYVTVALSNLMSIMPDAVGGQLELSIENVKTIKVLIRQAIETTPMALDRLMMLLEPTDTHPDVRLVIQYYAALLLTLVDLGKANAIDLQLSSIYGGRGCAKMKLEMYEATLEDLDICLEDLKSEIESTHAQSLMGHIFGCRAFVRAMLQDYDSALEDANMSIELDDIGRPGVWLNRGVLKRMMQDLDGALDDINKSLQLGGDYFNVAIRDYNVFKHRGYIKYLQGDVPGAREDGERARWLKLTHAIQLGIDGPSLGQLTVKYLEFEL